jgi:hypothetical protein
LAFDRAGPYDALLLSGALTAASFLVLFLLPSPNVRPAVVRSDAPAAP